MMNWQKPLSSKTPLDHHPAGIKVASLPRVDITIAVGMVKVSDDDSAVQAICFRVSRRPFSIRNRFLLRTVSSVRYFLPFINSKPRLEYGIVLNSPTRSRPGGTALSTNVRRDQEIK